MSLNILQYGLGTWGSVVKRNLISHPDFNLLGVIDPRFITEQKIDGIPHLPGIGFESLEGKTFNSQSIDAAYLAIPVEMHYDYAKNLISRKIPCIIEKPLARNLRQAIELQLLSVDNKVPLLGGLIMTYHPHVISIKSLIESGKIGKPLGVIAERVSLGRHQPVGIIDELAPHDLSILNTLFGGFTPKQLWARDLCGSNITDFVTCSGISPGNLPVTITWSWVSPIKSRRIIIVGSEKMILWDTSLNPPIQLHNKKASVLWNDFGQKIDNFPTFRYDDNGSSLVETDEFESVIAQLDRFSSLINNGTFGICDSSLLVAKQLESIHELETLNE